MKGFFAAIPFSEFIRHFRKMTIEEAGEDVMKSMDDIEELKEDGKSFGSLMVRLMNERISANSEKNRINGKKGGRPKKSPQDAPNGNAGDDMTDAGNGAAAKTPTSCDQLTADGDTREGSRDMHPAREGGTLESGTSADIFALDGLTKPRAPGTQSKSRGARVPEVPDSEDLYEHVAAEGLDEFDARQWFEMCSDRGWKDRYGNPIGNWKGALKRFCDAKARRRGKEKEG